VKSIKNSLDTWSQERHAELRCRCCRGRAVVCFAVDNGRAVRADHLGTKRALERCCHGGIASSCKPNRRQARLPLVNTAHSASLASRCFEHRRYRTSSESPNVKPKDLSFVRQLPDVRMASQPTAPVVYVGGAAEVSVNNQPRSCEGWRTLGTSLLSR
jgi:hypothetical protein